MTKYISPEKQRLIIEDLYNTSDSITATRKFNDRYEDSLGRVGEVTMSLYDFAKILNKSHFNWYHVDKAIKKATGVDMDMGSL